MTFPNIRRFSIPCLLAVPVALLLHQGPAMAASVTSTYTTNSGKTFTVTKSSSFNQSTKTASFSESVTGPNGKVASASVTSTPDGRGGLTVSRSVTGFNGQTHSGTHTVGR